MTVSELSRTGHSLSPHSPGPHHEKVKGYQSSLSLPSIRPFSLSLSLSRTLSLSLSRTLSLSLSDSLSSDKKKSTNIHFCLVFELKNLGGSREFFAGMSRTVRTPGGVHKVCEKIICANFCQSPGAFPKAGQFCSSHWGVVSVRAQGVTQNYLCQDFPLYCKCFPDRGWAKIRFELHRRVSKKRALKTLACRDLL